MHSSDEQYVLKKKQICVQTVDKQVKYILLNQFFIKNYSTRV